MLFLLYAGRLTAQFFIAFLGAPLVNAFIPVSGDARTFVHAAVFAVLVWITGFVLSFAARRLARPGAVSLTLATTFALLGAAAMVFAPGVLHAAPIKFPPLYLPLAGALTGYYLGR